MPEPPITLPDILPWPPRDTGKLPDIYPKFPPGIFIPDDWQIHPPEIEFGPENPEGGIPKWITVLIDEGWRYDRGCWNPFRLDGR